MSVLATPLSLGNGPGKILDVEALVRKVVKDRLSKWDAKLDPLEKEDLISYLISTAWELSCRYDPAKDKRPNLAAYVAHILSLRIADWYRNRFGDTRHGEKPVVLYLEGPALDGPKEGADRLVDTLAASGGDPAVDRSPDLVGLLQRGSGGRPGTHDALGEPAAGRAARGARGAGAVKPRVPGTFRAPGRPPICPDCFKTFNKAFHRVNKHVAAELRLDDEQLTLKAAKRSAAVKIGTEWACPRCTKLEDEKGYTLLLQEAYPNRAARRRAAKAMTATQGAKNTGQSRTATAAKAKPRKGAPTKPQTKR